MIVTFPHLGDMSCVLSHFFNQLGVPHVVPPPIDRETIQEGSEISPEEMCLPFKLMAGNLKRAYELGADTAVMAATCGPCRLGEYCRLLMEVMENAGCSYKWILLDSPSDIGLGEFLKRCRKMTAGGHAAAGNIAKAAIKSLSLTFKMDSIVRRMERRAGYLERPYEAVELMHHMKRNLMDSLSFDESRKILEKTEKKLIGLSAKENPNPVTVLITGEIYTSIEFAANNRLSEQLMTMGCSVKRNLSLSWWIKHTMMDMLLPESLYRLTMKRGGIPCNIGGYARETVDSILRNNSCDGVVKIMPAGCMPEIVAKAFCQQPGFDDYRMLHLIYDGLSGDAGYRTRLEAFVDMLERRKGNVLAGDRHRVHKY